MSNQTPLDQDAAPAMPERGEDFADILSQYEQSHSHKPEAGGQGLEGTVVAISGDRVFFDVGLKIEGVMPITEFREAGGKPDVHAGDKFLVSIQGRDEEGITCSPR